MAVLEPERETFERNLPAWLGSHRGEFVSIRGDKVAGFFQTRSGALEQGYTQFGLDADFLVKEVEEADKSGGFSGRTCLSARTMLETAAQFDASVGPLIKLTISFGGTQERFLRLHGRRVPDGVEVQALLDTGCTGVALDFAIIDRLGLEPRDYTVIPVADGVRIAPKCYAKIALDMGPGTCVFDDHPCTLFSGLKELTGADALIGLDIMQFFVLELNGPKGTFVLSKPNIPTEQPAPRQRDEGSDYYDEAHDVYYRYLRGTWRRYSRDRKLWDLVKDAVARLKPRQGNDLDRPSIANVDTRPREHEGPLAGPVSSPPTSPPRPPEGQRPLLLQAERRAFLQQKEQLLAKYRGQYVAFVGASVVASAPTHWQVIQEAARKVGKRPMLVEQVVEDRFGVEPELVQMPSPTAD